MKYTHVFIITLLLLITRAGPILGAHLSPPPEPIELTNSKDFLLWELLPNSMIVFEYSYITPDSNDPIYRTTRKVKAWGSLRSKEKLNIEEKQWIGLGYLFLHHYESMDDAYTWYAVYLYPLFYEYDNIIFIDREEDGLNGNEEIYEIFGQHKTL